MLFFLSFFIRDTGQVESCDSTAEDWTQAFDELQRLMQAAARHLVKSENHNTPSKFRRILQSAVEQQFIYALGK